MCEESSVTIKISYLPDTNKKVSVAKLIIHKRRSKKIYNDIKFDAYEGQADDINLFIYNSTICKICSYLTYPSKKLFT